MSDYDLPDLPSDEELGLTEEDIEKYGDDLPDDGPELSEEEMAMLLGGTSASSEAPARSSGESRADRRAAKKKAKEAKKKARAAEKAAAAERRAAKKAAEKAASTEPASESTPAEAERPDEADSPAESVGAAGAKAGSTPPPASGAGSRGPGTKGGPAALAPTPSWRGPVTLVFLLALATFASTRTGQVDPGPTNAPESDFSSARAMALLSDIARAPHPPGSPEHARVRGLLLDRLRQLGMEPEVQTATTLIEGGSRPGGRPEFARAATVRNVVARLPGSNPTGAVLVTAHYDSREIAVGAGDDGAGVVTILEALRALRTGPPLRNDLIVLFTDAEELGLMGARAFVDQSPLMGEVDLVLSFEMRGGGGPSIMFETNDRNGWVVRAFQSFDPHPFANSMAHEVYRRMPNDTDFTPFREAGVQGLNFAAIDNARVYHQTYDTPENLSASTVQHHGLHALSALRYFGDEDLTLVNDGNVVFFSLPAVGLVVYPQFWVLPLSLVLVVLFLVALGAAKRSGARPLRIVLGTAVAISIAVLAFALASAAFSWLTGLHPEYGALHGSSFHSEGWYVLAIAFTALLLVTGAAAVTRRWVAPIELATGALVLPLFAALAAGFVAPLAAMNFQWPVAAGLVGVTIMGLLGARASGTVGWLVFLVTTVPVFLFLQPVLELLWLAMTLEVAGVLAVVAVTVLLLALPLLGSLEAPNRWWAPLASFVLLGACMAAGVINARPSADRPAPSTLIYAYQHGSSEARWFTSPGAGADGVGQADTTADGVSARGWAEARAGAAFEERASLEPFGFTADSLPAAPARVLLVEPPEVEVAADTVLGGARRLTLNVRSRIGAEALVFALEGETRLTGLNGVPVSDVERIRWVAHWGTPDTAVVLELSTPPGAAAELHFIEHLLRPGELLGRDAFRRPPELAPNVNRQSDRALFRSTFSDPAADMVTSPPEAGVPAGLIRVRSDTLVVPADTLSPADTLAPVDTLPDTVATTDTVVSTPAREGRR